jgi:hypothetical protein
VGWLQRLPWPDHALPRRHQEGTPLPTQLLAEKSPDQEELIAYLAEPHSLKLSKNRLYRFLRILQLPTSRELLIARNALRSLKVRGESE